MNLVKKIQENIFRYELFKRRTSAKSGSVSSGKIVIGVSGGPDSVCLLDVLCQIKEKYGLKIIVAHVNYGLRGKDSKRDEMLVKKLAGKYSLQIEVKNIPCSTFHIPYSEEKLRIIRYDFFEKIRRKYKADAIAIGHNLNDQAETVLMRILRGTGLRGIGAIKFRNNKIIRPLLNVPRKDILAHLRKNKTPYRIDKTNLANNFTRNKIRNRLIPYLERNFNPNIQEVLYKMSQSTVDDYNFISRYSKEWLAMNKTLRVSELNQLHPAIKKEVFRLIIEKYNPDLREIESRHIDEILKVIKSKKNKRQIIKFKKLKIIRKGDKLNIIEN